MNVGHGMELVTQPTTMAAPAGTRVFSRGETMDMLRDAVGGGGGTQVHATFHINTGPLDSAGARRQLGEEMSQMFFQRFRREMAASASG